MAEAERVLLDASALLAFAADDPGAERVGRALPIAAISAVNAAECIAVLSRFMAPPVAALALARLGLNVISFDWETAVAAAELHRATRRQGLSLTDCVCLATALRLGIPVVTADSAWNGLNVGVTVEMLC